MDLYLYFLLCLIVHYELHIIRPVRSSVILSFWKTDIFIIKHIVWQVDNFCSVNSIINVLINLISCPGMMAFLFWRYNNKAKLYYCCKLDDHIFLYCDFVIDNVSNIYKLRLMNKLRNCKRCHLFMENWYPFNCGIFGRFLLLLCLWRIVIT